MKMKNVFTCALCAGLLFAACNKEEDGAEKQPETGEITYATLVLTEASSPLTRAIGNDDDVVGSATENEIKHIEVYIFNESDGARKASSNYYKITASSIANNKARFALLDGQTKFLVAVNLDLGQLGTDNYANVKKKIADYSLSNTNSVDYPLSVGFPMSGKAENVTITNDNPDNQVTIPVSRLISKVNPPVATTVPVNLIQDDQEELWNEYFGTDVEFELKGYAVINGLNKSDAFFTWNATDTEAAAWETWERDSKDYQKTTFEDATGELTLAYSGASFLTGNSTVVYVNENDPKEDTDAGGMKYYEKDDVYALLIKGTLTPDSDNTKTVTRYWRINFYKEDNYRIYRNGVYTVTINSVISKGYGTAKEAEEDEDNGPNIPGNDQTGVLATIDVQPWRVFNQSSDM